jgi:hypothetical protein
MVYHRIHIAGRNPEKETRDPHFFEISQVIPPVWLRHDCHPVTPGFQNTPYNSRSERRMINISVSGKKDDIYIPVTQTI